MITQQLSVSILTAPLAAIDRRALSQAWYSALHLAHAENARASCGHPSSALPFHEREQRHAAARSIPAPARDRSAQRLPKRSVQSRSAEAPERRAERSSLARRIERMFLDPVRRVNRATFTLDGAQARVHVALQTTASGTRLVAVCPAAVRAGVARALSEARYALAVRGVVLHVDLSES